MRDHFAKLLRLLDVEHDAELEQNKLELTRLAPSVREALGRSVTRLAAEDAGVSEGDRALLAFSRPESGEELVPFHAMNRGDLVSAQSPTGERFDGTVYDIGSYRAVVAMNAPPPQPLPRGRWTLHLVGSDATYRRMKRAIEDVERAEKKPVARLREVSFGRLKAASEKQDEFDFFDRNLNEFQRDAVVRALAAKDFALVHGPPGTGKTRVLIEVIRQSVARGERVLATAPSNVAVDNLLERLLDAGLRVVRMGHPARTANALRHATLDAQLVAHPDSKKIRDLDRERERLMIQRSRRADRGQLGYDERHERQREIRELWREARGLQKVLAREVLSGAQVVLATHGSIGTTLARESFDVAVLDEASQAVEPLSWLPLQLSRKAVLAGDPLQLPPTLHSEQAAKDGLALTLFERLQEVLPAGMQTLLRLQYRMHAKIMEFPSAEFYSGALIADDSVKSRLACELPGVRRAPLTENPLAFVDTAGAGFSESWDELLQSRENAEEAVLAVRLARELIEYGLAARDIGVITPYVAQVRRLKSLELPPDVEVGTVDGFQGREKEAIIVSLVRSNERGEVGFLEDQRRLNVALTRAKRLLLVLGDSATIARQPVYERFIAFAERSSAHRSAWEWINA